MQVSEGGSARGVHPPAGSNPACRAVRVLDGRTFVLHALGLFALCLAGSMLTGHAFFLVVLERRDSWACWNDPGFGMFYWPFVGFGALWAWGCAITQLWERRWLLAGSLVIAGCVPVVLLAGSGLLLAGPFAGYGFVAVASRLLGRARFTAS